MRDTVAGFKDEPVVRPDACSDRTARMPTYIAGVLNVSNMICVVFSQFAFGFVDDPPDWTMFIPMSCLSASHFVIES